MQLFFLILPIAIGLLSASGPAFANDSEAAFGVGGLVLKKSAHVEMLSEDLFVSLDQIVVKYRFKNTSENEVRTVVAFPLPAIKYNPDDPYGEYEFSFDRFDGFATSVNGNTIRTDIEDKAMLRGNDETPTLSRYGIPLDPRTAHEELARSTDSATKELLRRLSLLNDQGQPLWSLTRTFYWEQDFPPGAIVSIEHRYKPIVGGGIYTGLNVLAPPNDQRDFYKRFCVDRSFLAAVRKRAKIRHIAGDALTEGWSESWIEYILTTGANWSGPIRKFRLVVDKGRADNLVSFCGQNVRKIGPTLFEFTSSNFVPSKDLFVLILTPSQYPDESDDNRNDISALSCHELWVRRNSIFKDRGYCFKTAQAISEFGNAGCSYDDVGLVPLSNADRALLDDIRSAEKAKHCLR